MRSLTAGFSLNSNIGQLLRGVLVNCILLVNIFLQEFSAVFRNHQNA